MEQNHTYLKQKGFRPMSLKDAWGEEMEEKNPFPPHPVHHTAVAINGLLVQVLLYKNV